MAIEMMEGKEHMQAKQHGGAGLGQLIQCIQKVYRKLVQSW